MQIVAKKGIGKTHAKWSPVATCIMRKQPLVRIDHDAVNKKLSVEQRREFVSKCPRGVYKMNDFKQEVEIENADNCSLCQECTKFSQEVGLPSRSVMIGENDSRFIFTIEGTGALPPEEIVLRSVKILQKKISDLSEALVAPRYINP
jgi:DNA-directed RNA polymerase alpha subunit